MIPAALRSAFCPHGLLQAPGRRPTAIGVRRRFRPVGPRGQSVRRTSGPFEHPLWFAAAILAAAVVCGCSSETTISRSDRSGVAPENGTTTGAGTSAAAPDGTPPATTERRRDEVWVDDEGRKWFGTIPFDVFFDEPYAVAANQTPIGPGADPVMPGIPSPEQPANDGGSSPAPGPETPAGDPGTPETPDAAATAFAWDQLIDAQTLDDEVKSIRNFFRETLQSVGNYNSSMLMIPPRAATMSVLAAVAGEHPEEVSWKDDAGYVRDLAAQMNSDTLQRGAKDQRRLRALYESISDTLNRSRPAGLEEPAAIDSIADVAEMRLVMMRMSQAEQQMRTEAGSEGSFEKNKDMVLHEAAILATLTHTVTLEGYGYSDDPTFVGYGQEIVEAARSIINSANSGDFSSYELSLSKISTTCQTCHSEYKND